MSAHPLKGTARSNFLHSYSLTAYFPTSDHRIFNLLKFDCVTYLGLNFDGQNVPDQSLNEFE